jgi:2,3-bisphosphoglycerate-dependent phosphoglycerate mutase
MLKLVLVRHGESIWNLENRFTGWADIDLSDNGIQEACDAGKLLEEGGYQFDAAYTSVLRRAIRTLWIILDKIDFMWIPQICSWRLNESHYGALQGLNKGETAVNFGPEQVHIWRRSYGIRPPALNESDKRHPCYDSRYILLSKDDLPCAESLRDTEMRVLPLWQKSIATELKQGKKIIVSSHGNTIRALIKHFDGISDADITGVDVPTGIPLVYEFNTQMRAIRHYYLDQKN